MSDMALHVKNLEIFFKLYIPFLSDMKRAILKQTIIELYNEFHIDWNTDIKKLTNTDFPTFTDLYNLLEEKSKTKKDAEHKELALLFHDLALGSDQFLWKGHSTVETTSRCICLDTHSLQNTGENIKRAQYFTLLSWCWEQMSKDLSERVMLICDEYKQPEDFTPTHSLVLFTNHLPRVGSTDSGTWRRILAVLFKAVIDGNSEVKNYAEQLYNRCGEAVLSWIIAGAVKFCKAGHTIKPPEAVRTATAEYKERSNWIKEFLYDCCEVSDTSQCRAGELYTTYREWAQNSGEYIRNKTDFVAELERNGFDRYKNRDGTHWIRRLIQQQ